MQNYICWLVAEFRDEASPALGTELDEWMNKASKWSGGAGYAGLGDQDVGEIPTAMGAVLPQNEAALGVVGSFGLKVVTHSGQRMLIATGEFTQLCIAMGIL